MEHVTLAIRAAKLNEVRKFLLGKMPYDMKSKYSPSGEPNDITESWSAISQVAVQNPSWDLNQHIHLVLMDMCSDQNCLATVASVLLCEASLREDERSAFSFDLYDISQRLREKIRENWNVLKSKKTGVGRQWPDGTLGELRRISTIMKTLGGPEFFPVV